LSSSAASGSPSSSLDLRYQDEVHGDLFTQVNRTLEVLLAGCSERVLSSRADRSGGARDRTCAGCLPSGWFAGAGTARRRCRALDRVSLRCADRGSYLVPALQAKLVEMTLPDTPCSRKQRYRLTAAGLKHRNEIEAGR